VTLDSLGLAAALVLLLALAHLGATLAPGRWGPRERWRSKTIATALILGAALALVWPSIRFRVGLDLEPKLPALAAVFGEWRDGADTVNFRIVGYNGQLRLALLPLEGDVGPIDGRLYYAKVQ